MTATGSEVAGTNQPTASDAISILAAFPVSTNAAPGLAMLGDAGAACADGVCAAPDNVGDIT